MKNNTYDVKTLQGMIATLQAFWAEQGCVIVQPLDMEVGAGTFHPATFLRAIGPEPWRGGVCTTLQTAWRWTLW